MTSTAQITRTTTTQPVSLMRSVNSEFYKLWATKLTKITSLLAIALTAAPITAAILLSKTPLTSNAIFGTWGLTGIFFLVIGVSAVASEYSHNTMRTTVLSDPHRLRAFTAKSIAMIAYTFTLAAVIVAVLMACTLLSKTPITFTSSDVGPTFAYIGFLVGVAIMGVAFGYLLHSTAGGITAGVVVLQFLPLITLIPVTFFQKTLVHYLPSNLANYAILGMPPGVISGNAMSAPYSQAGAFALFILYPLLLLILGMIRFLKSDV